MVDDMEFQEKIYDLVNGFWDIDSFPVPESVFVKDEFAAGSCCNIAYGKALEAYARLCLRLQSDTGEDSDVEIIINEMHTVMKHIALQMFRYGVFFTRRENGGQ